MSTLGERLKCAREAKGYLQSELARLIGVKSSGVISNWENDVNKPDAEKIVRLCDALEVSASFLLDYYGKSAFELHPLERDLIAKYRALDPYGQETVAIILDRESARVRQLAEHHGRPSAVIDFAEHKTARMCSYSYMHRIAAAGVGFYFDDIPTDTIRAPYCENADFIIGVSGDSMEPTYSDGDLVYVQKQQVVEVGEVGIFVVDGECFIKEAGEDTLISHNKRYPPIPGGEHINCVGKVLGKVPE